MKTKTKTYQTVGQRLLIALNRVTISENLEFKKKFKARSSYLYRIALKENYDKDDSPAYLIGLSIKLLNMNFEDFIPQKNTSEQDDFLKSLGLVKPKNTNYM